LNEQDIHDVAIAEILNPTLAHARQYLVPNKVVFENDMPFVEDIILREEGKTAEVYFPIEGERYYVVVYIDLEPQVSVRWMDTSAGNRVYLRVISEKHSLEELIALAGVEPTGITKKGQHAARHNGFQIQPYMKETGEAEDKLRSLIKILLPHKANLRALATIASIEIQIAYWGYKDEMWGINFDEETIQGLAELNLSVNVDLYAGGPDLGEV
jgi:hypothetical protein